MNRPRRILATALLRTAHLVAGQHLYLSTSCQHDQHAYCSSATGTNGHTRWAKTASHCKFCPSVCICHCHRETGHA
ncbi:hypothetical protein [Streptomyces sp. NPDC001404]|uniref:hypothetical protein n=1 Tax=Streptomyces sp. NPDC001404 TaxID=3364571 RepID=UPI0036B86A93